MCPNTTTPGRESVSAIPNISTSYTWLIPSSEMAVNTLMTRNPAAYYGTEPPDQTACSAMGKPFSVSLPSPDLPLNKHLKQPECPNPQKSSAGTRKSAGDGH